MKRVGIAELKSHLSEHLREVRRGGTVTVLDRGQPIARLSPFEGTGEPLTVRSPRAGAPPPGRVPMPSALQLPVDVIKLLLEERQSHR